MDQLVLKMVSVSQRGCCTCFKLHKTKLKLSKERWLRRRRRAERSYSTFKVRRGGCEELPLVQGKEQRLRFAGAAVKRYPTSKVRETPVRR